MSAQFITSVITIVIALLVILTGMAYLILLERKISSWIQDRIGPNRAGPAGLLQPVADGIKFLFKEDYTPAGVDKGLFALAPLLAMLPAMLGWAVIPWGGFLQSDGFTFWSWLPGVGGATVEPFVVNITGAQINIGVVYILAIGSLAVYGVVLGGYASNNKYSFFGGLRATAQMLSYEIPQGLCVLIILLLAGSAGAKDIVHQQANEVWYIFYHPLLAVIFFACVLAECNRLPFDLAEAESELVGGYHTEYSSMRFALFFMGEYMHMITGSAFFVLLFLGGWDLAFVTEPIVGGIGLVLLKCSVFAVKVTLCLALMMVIRWTLPRFRFDQLMRLAWRSLIPVTLVILLGSVIVVFFKPSDTMNFVLHLGLNVLVFAALPILGSLIPAGPPVNRRVPLTGSRFNPPTDVT